ncbi:MAG: hypothetical protein U0230_07955 [Polyangiales bacterium]
MTKHLRVFLLLLAMPAIVAEQGCNCDPSYGGGGNDAGMGGCVDQGGAICTPPGATQEVCLPDSQPCNSKGNGFSCPAGSLVANAACTDVVCGDENNSACVPPPPMNPGLRGQFIDSVLTTDGILHYSAYDIGAVVDSVAINDLIVGHYNPTSYKASLASMEPDATDPNPLDPTKRNLVQDWTIVDGLPSAAESAQAYDPAGWRGGDVAPGPDEGAYSSIAALGTDLYVAYEERPSLSNPTAHSLRIAYGTLGQDGKYTWKTSTVDSTAGGALYPSITIFNGVPTIAYGLRQAAQYMTSGGAMMGTPGDQPTGWVRVATASAATPDATSGEFTWTLTDLVDTITTIGCIDGDGLCGAGATCVQDGTSGRGRCGAVPTTPTCKKADGTDGCDTGTCWHDNLFNEDFCSAVKKSGDLIDATGLFNNLVPLPSNGGLGLVYYDRGIGRMATSGTLRCNTSANCAAQNVCVNAIANVNNSGYCMIPGGDVWGMRLTGTDPTTWGATTRILVDGYARKATGTDDYDAGYGATMTIDSAGVWHVAYVDGIFERLRYAQVQTNNTVNNRETVDDGYGGANRPASRPINGQHRQVGEESSIVVTSTGEVRILYGDATGLVPVFAVRTAPNAWTVSELSVRTNSGLFTSQLLDPTENSWCAWMERTLPVTPIEEDRGETIVYCSGTSCPP